MSSEQVLHRRIGLRMAIVSGVIGVVALLGPLVDLPPLSDRFFRTGLLLAIPYGGIGLWMVRRSRNPASRPVRRRVQFWAAIVPQFAFASVVFVRAWDTSVLVAIGLGAFVFLVAAYGAWFYDVEVRNEGSTVRRPA